jgi:molybdopterin converting factor small subunit
MASVWIPSLMRDLTAGCELVSASGGTVGEVIVSLEGAYPGIQALLCRGNQLAPGLAAAVDGRIVRLGLMAPVEEQSEVRFLPAIAGG